MSPLHWVTCVPIVVWWNWLRRARSVVESAMPMLPPKFRTTLKAAVALVRRSIRIVASASVWSGTNTKPWPKPWMKRGQRQRPVVHAEGDRGHQHEGDGVERAAESEEPALVDARDQPARDEERDHVADAAGSEHDPRRPRVVAHQLLRVEGEQHGARVEAEPDGGHHDRSHREVSVVEHREVQDRLGRRQLAHEEAGDGAHRDHGQAHHEAGVEPVGALALVEHELERAEPDDHEGDARPVDRARLLRVRRIEQEGAGHEEPERHRWAG